jgi:hypothetical protein
LLPPVINPAGIVEHVRKHGSLAYPLDALPHDFANWRLQLRRHARARGVPIRVTRGSDQVFVLARSTHRYRHSCGQSWKRSHRR